MKSDGLSTDFWSTGSGDNHIYFEGGGRGTAPSVDCRCLEYLGIPQIF